MTNRPCPKCGGDNIRFGLMATANGRLNISAQCRDCAKMFILNDRAAITKMWNDGFFEEVDEDE